MQRHAAQPYKLDETPAERVNTWGKATYKYFEVPSPKLVHYNACSACLALLMHVPEADPLQMR